MNIIFEERMRESASRPRIYFDHAATTSPRPEVLDVVIRTLQDDFGNPSSFYQEGHRASWLLEDARARIAACLQVQPEEIFFTSCGTESDNWAIKGAAYARQSRGRHLITTTFEHHAVLHSMEALERDGFEITYLDVDHLGILEPEKVREALRDDTICLLYTSF